MHRSIGGYAPFKGANSKSVTPSKNFERNLFELREFPIRRFLIFRGQCPRLSEYTKISGPKSRNVAKGEKIEILIFFETRYLPQMVGDSPQIKYGFLEVPRPIICIGHLGGTLPLRGHYEGKLKKVPRPQKF